MRVFPRWRITGPRLPVVKSYSFFILQSFVPRGEPRRNETHVLASVGIHGHDDSAHNVETDRDEAPLLLGRVIDGNGVGIEEHALCIGKAHAMLAKVRLSLNRIPDGRHVCTLYAYAIRRQSCLLGTEWASQPAAPVMRYLAA